MRYKKQFGNNKNNMFLSATDWTGKHNVLIITPVHPTKNQKRQTMDFLLDELDDHSAYDVYLNKLRRGRI